MNISTIKDIDLGILMNEFTQAWITDIPLKKNFEVGIRTHLLSTNNGSFLLWKSYDSAYNALDDQTTTTSGLKYRIDPFITFRTPKGWEHNIKTRMLSIDNQVDNGDTSVNQSNKSTMYYADYQSTLPH